MQTPREDEAEPERMLHRAELEWSLRRLLGRVVDVGVQARALESIQHSLMPTGGGESLLFQSYAWL